MSARLIAVLAGLAAVMLPALAVAHGDEIHDAAAEQAPAPAQPLAEEQPVANMKETMAMPPVSQAAETPHPRAAPSPAVQLLKNLHPATVHFPIALLLAAALAELGAAVRSSSRMRSAAEVMTIAGAAGTAVAALFGWIHTGLWLGGDLAMQAHRWIGTGLVLLAAAAGWLALKPLESRALFRFLLAVIAGLLLVQGYLGGELAHGAGHLFAAGH